MNHRNRGPGGRFINVYTPAQKKLYKRWSTLLQRCETPSHISYRKYGARGITVCAEWHDFIPFFEWAVSHGYQDGLTIDRVDSSGPYSPENCRWATPKEQARNMRSNVLVNYRGETKCLAQWCEELGLPYSRTYNRLVVCKWPAEKAFLCGDLRRKDK